MTDTQHVRHMFSIADASAHDLAELTDAVVAELASTRPRPSWMSVDVNLVSDPTLISVGRWVPGPSENEQTQIQLVRTPYPELANFVARLAIALDVSRVLVDRTGLGLPVFEQVATILPTTKLLAW